MAWWLVLLDTLGALLLLVLVLGVVLVVRRRFLGRHGGTFELSVRDPRQPTGRGWALGLGRYREDHLEWFRIFSPSPRPRRTWGRNELTLDSQRQTDDEEGHALYSGHLVVHCSTPQGEVELAMSPESLTGLQSWLEAGPPGSRPSR